MREGERSFRGPLGLPIEVSTARAMSNVIINYPVVVRCYRTCASPSLSLPSSHPCQLSPSLGPFRLYLPARRSPSFPFLSAVLSFLALGLSISLLKHVDSICRGREGSFRLARTNFRLSIFILDTRITSLLSSI